MVYCLHSTKKHGLLFIYNGCKSKLLENTNFGFMCFYSFPIVRSDILNSVNLLGNLGIPTCTGIPYQLSLDYPGQ